MAVTDTFRLFGSELSPYSVKVRSYLRYKGMPHEWIPRSAANQAEFQKHAKLPLIPLVITPEGEGLQDSTPIIEHFEAKASGPSIVPDDPALAFLSALIEEYADEWTNKWMFHYRWSYPADCWATAERIALQMMGDQGPLAVAQARAAVAERMTGRLGFVGSNPVTRPLIEASFTRAVEILDRHLAARPYLLGGRPAMADFGLWGQFYEMATDPTPGAQMRTSAKHVMAWVERMVSPRAEGSFESWNALSNGLMPLLKQEVGVLFLPWSAANAAAIQKGEKSFEVKLAGAVWSQEPQKYHARSLAEIRRKYATAKGAAGLDKVLGEADCLRWLA
ncbi:glutathione S-transferase family protein [Enhydrobacter sp.]|jgi:glutathione S-transferase|uniref:glutathione S-transferase family protein n=1 Tax=Enhydrobacter sp. TaxID=1894999 RepID=UPI002602B1CC|nr:glutathione S-transferase family protein [Enhydrobacter sp.]WIM13643.1 MAG: Glutathione S-transferase [Enhydrobacter sp.]